MCNVSILFYLLLIYSSFPYEFFFDSSTFLFFHSCTQYLKKKGWGSTKQIEDLHKRGELGPKEEGVSASDYGVIADATHIEFSDCSMLTPTWIGRASGNCGKRSPHDTAQEIASRTILFLENVKEVQGKRKQE
mmetsp:Transcript_41283/g.62593  ORF Transcript_41283/g.62593 Transcript_41283/m.62593 type:complete len:133 (+) Transcript_41283:96-494(+)